MKQVLLVTLTVLVLLVIFLGLRKGSFNKPITSVSPTQTVSVPSASPTKAESQTPTSVPVSQITLEVTEPANNSIVSNSSVMVKGKTSPGADVFINEKELKADSSGNFSTSLNLDEGENYILVSANDSNGNFSEKEIIVNLETMR